MPKGEIMEKEELKKILERHQQWLNNEDGGMCANLSGADLSNTNLRGANLSCAFLIYANLSCADLSGVDVK